MFATITKNKPERIGKKFPKESYIGKSTTYSTGLNEWQVPYESAATRSFPVSHFSLFLS